MPGGDARGAQEDRHQAGLRCRRNRLGLEHRGRRAQEARDLGDAQVGSDSRYYTALVRRTSRRGRFPAPGFTWDRLGIASGTQLTGSLACGVAQGQAGSLLLFTPGTKLYSGAAAEITEQRAGIGKVRVFGSYNVIGMTVRSSIAKLMRAK